MIYDDVFKDSYCKTRITATAWGVQLILNVTFEGGGGGTLLTKSTIKASWI